MSSPAPGEGTEAAPRGFLGTLLGIYGSPSLTLASIARNPRFLAPLLGLTLLNVAFTAVWLSKVDPPEFVRAQAEQSARFTNLPPDQQETVVASQAKFFPPIAWVTAFVGAPILVSVVVLALVFVFRFVLADETTIRQGYAVVSWSYFAIALVQLPLILVTLFLKGEWRISPQEAFLASPALLLDKNAASKALFAFLGSLDVFSFWSILLISWGFAAAGRRRFGAAFWGVLVPWLVYVIAKVFLVALNS